MATLSAEKSAKLARSLAACFDALLAQDRVRAEVYAPERSPRPISLAEQKTPRRERRG
jgi:hypothetical protein